MNEITITTTQLPNTLEDLSKFILVGQEQVVAVRAQIKAMSKLKFAEEVVKQKGEELQMITEALVDAQVRVGQLTKELPKGSGRPNNSLPQGNELSRETKIGAIHDMGFSKKQVHEFEQMAKHPELVEQAKEEARQDGEPVTRARVLNLIKQQKHQDENIIDMPPVREENEYHHIVDGYGKEHPVSKEQVEVLNEQTQHDFKKIEDEYAFAKNVSDGISKAKLMKVTDVSLQCFLSVELEIMSHEEILTDIEQAINKLTIVKEYIRKNQTMRVVK